MSAGEVLSPDARTPLPVVAEVSRLVTKLVDRVTGDRSDYPLLVALAATHALRRFGVGSRVIFGECAWIEIMQGDHRPLWTGCWGGNHGFWVSTEFGEVVDLNVSVSFRKLSHGQPDLKPFCSPPMLWSREVPRFYRYRPEGLAEVEPSDLEDSRDRKWWEAIRAELDGKCNPTRLAGMTEGDLEFPAEPVLCPDRRVLDDASGTFKQFERALAVHGVPQAPF
ncbi:MAG: hypothetical protein IT285_14750 [Bdellovibrionales bacterium]|nr:hypothetical protein [Bdellovibrionales bacterium]